MDRKNRWSLYSMAFGNFAVGIGSLVVAGVLQPMADDLSVLYLGISAGSTIGGWVFEAFGVLMLPWAALSLTIGTLILFFISYSAESR